MVHFIPSIKKTEVILFGLMVFFLLSTFSPVLAHSEEREVLKQEEVYSLGDLLAIAILHDSNVKLMEIQVNEARVGLQSLEATLRPQLIFSGDYSIENVASHPMARQFVSIEIEFDGEVYKIELLEPDELVQTTMISLTLAKQLGPNLALRTAFEKASIGKEMSMLQREEAISQLVLQVQTSYHGVLKALYGKELASSVVDTAKKNVEVVQHRENTGTATMLDVLKEKNALLEAESHLSTAQMGLNVALLGLLQTIGLHGSYLTEDLLSVEQLETYEEEPREWVISFERAIDYALLHRKEIEMASSQLAMTELDYQEHKEKRDWTVSLTGNYVIDDYILDGSLDSNRLLRGTIITSDIKWPSSDVEDLLGSGGNGTDPWKVGVQLSYNFGQGSLKRAEEERLELASQRAAIQYERLYDGIYLEVYSYYQQLEQAWQSYQLARKGQEEALATYRNLEEMYRLGSLTRKDLMEAELFVNQAKNHVLSTALDYRVKKGQLARSLGIDSATLIEALIGGQCWSEIL